MLDSPQLMITLSRQIQLTLLGLGDTGHWMETLNGANSQLADTCVYL